MNDDAMMCVENVLLLSDSTAFEEELKNKALAKHACSRYASDEIEALQKVS